MWLSIPLDACGTCGGSGEQWVSWDHADKEECSLCRGRGYLYPPALVAVIEDIIGRDRVPPHERAVAVFDALNDTETP